MGMSQSTNNEGAYPLIILIIYMCTNIPVSSDLLHRSSCPIFTNNSYFTAYFTFSAVPLKLIIREWLKKYWGLVLWNLIMGRQGGGAIFSSDPSSMMF